MAASRTACYGNLSVETLSKIVLTDQHNTKTISVNTLLSREKRSECLSSPFAYSCQTISETRASFFINGLAENCPISSAVRLLIQKMFWAWDKSLRIASCVASQTWYFRGNRFEGGGSFNSSFFWSSFLNLTVKKLWKLVYAYWSCHKNKGGLLFDTQDIYRLNRCWEMERESYWNNIRDCWLSVFQIDIRETSSKYGTVR